MYFVILWNVWTFQDCSGYCHIQFIVWKHAWLCVVRLLKENIVTDWKKAPKLSHRVSRGLHHAWLERRLRRNKKVRSKQRISCWKEHIVVNSLRSHLFNSNLGDFWIFSLFHRFWQHKNMAKLRDQKSTAVHGVELYQSNPAKQQSFFLK